MRKGRRVHKRLVASKQQQPVQVAAHSVKYERLLRFLNRINISRHIALHLIGSNHTPTHRKIVGVLIMIFGGVILGSTLFTHSVLIHVGADIIGNSFHGIGLIPFVKDVEKIEKQMV